MGISTEVLPSCVVPENDCIQSLAGGQTAPNMSPLYDRAQGQPWPSKGEGFKTKKPEILLAASQLLGNTATESAYSTSPQQKINKIHKDTQRTNRTTITLDASSEKDARTHET